MYSGLSGFTASQYLMKPSVIFLPSRMVSLESVIWTMRAITPSSRLRVIQSSCPSGPATRSEEHTSELQSQSNLVCRLLLEKKKNTLCYCITVHSHILHETCAAS